MATTLAVAIGTLAAAADVLSQFQLTEDEAHEKTFDVLWNGTPPEQWSAAGIFRRLSPEARATAVTAAAAVARAYVESDVFRERYATERRARRPADVPATAGSASQVEKETAQAQKGLDEAREALANLPPEMRKMAEAMMKEAGAEGGDLDKMLAEQSDAVKKSAADRKAAINKANDRLAESRQSAKEFDATYPANPERLVAARLRQFLDYSATVPASAALVPRGGKMVFADPVLEKKPEFWKQLYRAGQPARDAARAAAAAWLKTLEGGPRRSGVNGAL